MRLVSGGNPGNPPARPRPRAPIRGGTRPALGPPPAQGGRRAGRGATEGAPAVPGRGRACRTRRAPGLTRLVERNEARDCEGARPGVGQDGQPRHGQAFGDPVLAVAPPDRPPRQPSPGPGANRRLRAHPRARRLAPFPPAAGPRRTRPFRQGMAPCILIPADPRETGDAANSARSAGPRVTGPPRQGLPSGGAGRAAA